MSSSVAKELVASRKLVVHIAENGHTIELDCDESTPVESVQRYVESISGIPFSDQLLLCLDMKLEPQRQLSVYKLPHENREVFLYNRARLLQDSQPPPPERMDVPEAAEPPSPSSSHDPHPLDDALDPAVKALPSYERQFRYHFQRGRTIFVATQAKFGACEKLLREQQVQERALETAKGSMDHYFRLIYQTYMDFMKCFSQQHRYHSDLLANFEKDLEKLRSCRLHPSLQTDSRKCLLDLLKEENLRKWVDSCGTSHKQFEMKVLQLKSMFVELKRGVEDLYSTRASASIRELEMAIRDHQKYLHEQKSIMQSLSKDVNTVKKLVDDCLSCQLSDSLRPHDAVSALGPMYDVHDKNHLPKMQACDRALSKLLNFCEARKNEMNGFVHDSMQKVAYVQYMVKDIRLQFPAFKEAMARQDDIFEELKLVRGVGPAYRACLAEVVRRKASMKLYMGMAGQLAERLATKRETEVRRREEFIKAQSVFIPRDILMSMGLFDSPNHCDVNVVPFDMNLLNIDIADLDRYAPENLFGVLAKAEKLEAQEGSITMSNSSHLTEVGESSIGTSDKCDTGELLGGSGSVEIAGTSKMEVENACLKAELASALARLCCLNPEIEYACLDDSKVENVLKDTAQKTEEALKLKDEYGKQLESILKMKQMQCMSYEKRIQELELRLQDGYLEGQKISGSQHASEIVFSTLKTDDCKSEICGDREGQMGCVVSEPMDELSCTSALLNPGLLQPKTHEGVDENMTDLLGMLSHPGVDSARNIMDASMQDPHRDELQLDSKTGNEKLEGPLNLVSCDTDTGPGLASKAHEDVISELEKALQEKSNRFIETEAKLKAAVEDVDNVRKELENNQKLLDESQMNCAHLENCLHEAREEAHTNLCAADRRASEYSALRASAVKMRGLFERLRSCVTAPGGVAGFAESLRTLALSLGSPMNEKEDDGTSEFWACIRVLADKVGFLSRQRVELLERCSRAEAAHARLSQELEEKKELVKSLYAKHQLEKQANKERISFGRFEVHELAAFVLNSSGHYEAINRNCFNYYLSSESVALFADHLPTRPTYIIGQIVHIERKIVRASILTQEQLDDLNSDAGIIQPGSLSNPYNLPVGCEYFIVTVAMLPDTIHSSLS